MTVSLKTLIDRSVKRLGDVHPSIKEYTIELLNRCYNEGILVQISSGFRSNTDQAYIYGQGRPNYIWSGKKYGSSGSIVSNAKPGTSIHKGKSQSPLHIFQAQRQVGSIREGEV